MSHDPAEFQLASETLAAPENGQPGSLRSGDWLASSLASRKPWSEERKKRHREYMAEWRKKERNHIAQLESQRRSFKKHGHERHVRFVRENSSARTTAASRESEKKATMAREMWGVVEDALLLSGKTEGQLVEILGRSIRAIQRRKWKLRQEELANTSI